MDTTLVQYAYGCAIKEAPLNHQKLHRDASSLDLMGSQASHVSSERKKGFAAYTCLIAAPV